MQLLYMFSVIAWIEDNILCLIYNVCNMHIMYIAEHKNVFGNIQFIIITGECHKLININR